MRQALVARGVPVERIIGDFAGLRTLDSVVRAKEIFGVTEVRVRHAEVPEREGDLSGANGTGC
ncbi:MAG: hypothetical protein QM755_09060 [Luteolibacter sp.]